MKFFLARSTEQGSRTLVSAATAGEETHGAYLSDCRVAQWVSLLRWRCCDELLTKRTGRAQMC